LLEALDLLIRAVVERVFETGIREVVRDEVSRATASRPVWYDVAGAAAYCAMTKESIRSAEKRGQLRAPSRGDRPTQVPVDDLERFRQG
jgi:hypothetical protein